MSIDSNNQTNPVVLLSNNIWHIVEHSRQSNVTLYGKSLIERRAHSRLKTIGCKNACPRCLKLFDGSADY